MPKSHFRIIAFRCLKPEHPDPLEMHYVNRMQRSLAKGNRCFKFYQDVDVNDDGSKVSIPVSFYNDSVIYDTESMCVSVSAIVGENGSGKSSILDMMVRVLNNAATALMGEKPLYAAAEHVHYIENVYGSILFIQGAKLKRLDVRGRFVEVYEYKKQDYKNVEDNERDCYLIGKKEIWLDARDGRREELLPRKVNRLHKLANLFYSVVCNYSLYAYNPSDYWEEFSSEERISKISPKQDFQHNPYLRCWLTGLFHKNDGYQMPLVLNPMRLNGIINAPKENNLAKERLLSMLFYKDERKQDSVDSFPFRIINRDHVIVGLVLNSKQDEAIKWTKDWMVERHLFGKRSRLYTDFERIEEDILDYLQNMEKIDRNGINHKLACRYLVYKIIKIGLTYKKYNKIISNLRKKDRSVDLLHRHLEELVGDLSHITAKFRRTLMYLITDMYNNDTKYDLNKLYEEAEKFVVENNQFGILQYRETADFLPPPIFDIEFRIVKREDIDKNGEYNDGDIIPFWSLSSGERQIAYLISNFVYHLVNINSVHAIDNDVVAGLPLLKYRYINVIFDEIELYFHPDLQRRFLSLIVSALKNIHISHIEGINILLVTHSPFVLSDIPRSNVLALSDNYSVNGETFCANINEMLSDSFFMEYSMGQIAQEEIEEIFSKYNTIVSGENTPLNEEELIKFKYVTSIVGDEYLHSTLERVINFLETYVRGG